MSEDVSSPSPVPPEEIDLSMLLTPDDLAALVNAGLVPGEHTALDMAVVRMQQGRHANGQLVLLLTVPVPPDLFTKKSRLVLPTGGEQNELDEVMALPPRVHLVIRKDRLGDASTNQMKQHIAAQLTARPTG